MVGTYTENITPFGDGMTSVQLISNLASICVCFFFT